MANLAEAPPISDHHKVRGRRLVVIDDHETFADLLRVGLRGESDLECVGVAYDIDAGLALVNDVLPDMVVIDFMFAGDDRNGIAAAAAMRLRHPDLQIVLLTGCSDASLIHRAATAGVSAVAPKDGSLPDLLGILRSPRGTGLVVHPRLLRSLDRPPPPPPRARPTELSPREHDVLGMLAMGLDARAIAQRLGISLNTCRGYVKTMLRKLGAHSQLEAVAIASRQGLFDGRDAV